MLSYSHMTIWANQSWLALGLDLDGLWSRKFGMVLVMNPLDQSAISMGRDLCISSVLLYFSTFFKYFGLFLDLLDKTHWRGNNRIFYQEAVYVNPLTVNSLKFFFLYLLSDRSTHQDSYIGITYRLSSASFLLELNCFEDLLISWNRRKYF